MTKAAIWVRVSTDEQNVDNQLHALYEFVTRRGWEHVETYELTATSAYKEQAAYSETLRRALEDARRREFDVLVVWALDRLSRRGIHHVLGLLKQFEMFGVKVVSHQEQWTEVEGPARDLLYAVMAWVAEQESLRRSERVRAALAKAKAEGKRVGRPPGAKDKKPRKRAGYFARWEAQRQIDQLTKTRVKGQPPA